MTRTTVSRLLAIAALALGLSMPAFTAAADQELLDILLANGAITQEQYDRLIQKEAIDKEDVKEVVTSLDSGGLSIESGDGDFSIEIGARLHAQAAVHQGDLPAGNEPVDGTELRRARIETNGTFHGNWQWVGEVDFADNRVSIKDFWLGYKTEGGTLLSFGHQKQPYNLSLEESSNDIPFIERSIDNYLVAPFADRAIGFRVQNSGAHWFAAGGIYGDSVSPGSATDDEGWGIVGRFVYSPIVEADRVLHLGVRALLRSPSRDDPTYRVRDETTHMSNLRIVDTGTVGSVDRNIMTGVEAAYAQGPFSIVGEYSMLDTERDGLTGLNFDGWSVYATWSLTGESRAASYRMNSGEFKRLKARNDFSPANGTWGAWEVALRYASLDLNDAEIIGGEEEALTTALNWYLNPNVRLMLEWSRIMYTDGSSALRDAADGLNIFQFRTQYTF